MLTVTTAGYFQSNRVSFCNWWALIFYIMKYYMHDSNSFNDEKITELYIKFGYEGLGLFYTILEKFAAQEKPIRIIILKKQLNVGKKLEKCFEFMQNIGLIQSSNDECFNINVLDKCKKYLINKESTKKRVADFRDKQAVKENVTCYTDECNADKLNISKVNKVNKVSNEGNGIFYDTQKLSLVLQSEDSWLESIARKYKCTFEFARNKILDFINHLEAQGEESKTLQDAKSHYDNWFRIQKDLKLKTKNNATNRKAGSPIPQDELLQAVAKAYGYTNTNT